MTTVIAGPFQPDDVPTRERMRVATNTSLPMIQMFKLEHNGVIDYDMEYTPNVLFPSYIREWQADTYEDVETAYTYQSKAWLSTLGPPPGVGLERSYDAGLVTAGAGSHLQDPWVGDLLTDMTAAINAQVAAGTHPGVPAGLMSWSVEFLTDDDLYPGTVSGRSVEISSADIESHEYRRDGSDMFPGISTGLGAYDAIYGLAIPRSASDPTMDDPDAGDYATDFGPIGYATTGDTTGTSVPPDAWSAPTLEARATTLAPEAQYADGMELLGTVNVDGATETWPVDDAWWEANKWTITRFGSDVNYGVPLLLSPEWLILPAISGTPPGLPYGLERHTTGRASATLYMNAIWTPPPYRIVYDREFFPAPHRLLQRPADGLAGGSPRTYRRAGTNYGSNRTIGGVR